jgi:NAD(P)-dependent dehydrogenase (short-subunit alcohol dehydrogenase family)
VTLEDKVSVVTGGGSGLGEAMALRLARAGARVAVLEVNVDAAELTAKLAAGVAVPCDVSDSASVDAAAAEVEAKLGPIDVWVNNAMVTIFSPLHEITPEEYRRATEVTYLGTVWGTMSALRRMRPRNSGTIVQVGSALAYRGIPLQSPYCAAKHAIQGLNDSLRTELLHEGSKVHVTMVQMPALNTPQFDWCRTRMGRESQPVPPIFQPEVAAEAIVWASEHRRREMYVGLPTVVAIIGNKISGLAADYYLAKNGVDSQLTDEPIPPGRRDNLFEPLPGDNGAHGRFDTRAKPYSRQLQLSLHRRLLGAGAAAGFAMMRRFAS